jgi:hypothetical protein
MLYNKIFINHNYEINIFVTFIFEFQYFDSTNTLIYPIYNNDNKKENVNHFFIFINEFTHFYFKKKEENSKSHIFF